MLLLTVIISCLVIFIIGLLSPYRGTRSQIHLIRLRQTIMRFTQNKPRLLRFFVRKPAKGAHKVLHKSAELGKSSREKLTRRR